MLSKVVKFWHSLFPRNPEPPHDSQPADAHDHEEARRHPPAIVIRTALRQKQKLSKAST